MIDEERGSPQKWAAQPFVKTLGRCEHKTKSIVVLLTGTMMIATIEMLVPDGINTIRIADKSSFESLLEFPNLFNMGKDKAVICTVMFLNKSLFNSCQKYDL